MTEDRSATEQEKLPQQDAPAGGEEVGPDGKAIRKTYLEIREEARRAILPSHDREKYESMDPEDRDFVDAACLFEFNQQQVNKTRRRIKLRDIMLCRDVAQAYCPNRDKVGQYSEGKRILKNSEGGNETVRFVLGRKICSMLERIHNLYSSHPRNYVSTDLHKGETELLNYIGRLGKIIKDPLKEARRIYLKLKERTGWEIPPTAFGVAEGCDVPQLFFNRYSDPNQLLLKDPMKPFRSDTLDPPLNLDYRIKNAVLIMAGENRFFVDKKKFAAVRDTPTARAIAMKAIAEARDQIKKAYEKNTYELAECLDLDEDFNVRSVKEAAFSFFYGYTLQHLPNTAARADAAELFLLKLMPEENSIGCHGFTRWLFPPDAVEDDADPRNWNESVTQAYHLRKTFHDVGAGELRLAMFATRMTELLSDYLEAELQRLMEQRATPYDVRITSLRKRLKEFQRSHGEELEELAATEERLEQLRSERDRLCDEAVKIVGETFNKPLAGDDEAGRRAALQRVRPRIEQEAVNRTGQVTELKGKYTTLVERYNRLVAAVKQLDGASRAAANAPGDEAAERELRLAVSRVEALAHGDQPHATRQELRSHALQRLEQIKAAMIKLKARHQSGLQLKKKLDGILERMSRADEVDGQIAAADSRRGELAGLPQQLADMERELENVLGEREDAVGRIEEMIETNKET